MATKRERELEEIRAEIARQDEEWARVEGLLSELPPGAAIDTRVLRALEESDRIEPTLRSSMAPACGIRV